MPGADRLTIRRLTASYEVAGDHPAPESVRQRLDPALAAIGHDLGAALAPLAGTERDGLWLVRRIELELTVDASAEPALLRRTVARTLARAITRRLDRAADGVLFFPDRIGYLARFLADLAAGDAWHLWYYEAFAGLRVLPVAAALRTAILAEPERGLQALARLASAELARTLEALSPAEAERVLDGLAALTGEADAGDLLDHLTTHGWPQVSPACPARLALALLATMAGRQPVRGLVPFVRAMARRRHRRALVADLPTREIEANTARFTPFGGPFMLLQLLDELPLGALAGWPGSDGAPAATLVRALLLAKTVGGASALAFLLDPVWRDLLALPPAVPPAALARWTGGITPAHRRALRQRLGEVPRADRASRAFLALPRRLCNEPLDRLLSAIAHRLLDRLARRLPGFAGSSPTYLARNFLAVSARVETGEGGLCVTLSRPPLDMVLAMTGLARARLTLDWLTPPRLELRRGE